RGQVGSAVGLLHTSYSAVGIPGALFAGWLAERWGWRALFGVKAGFYLCACGVLFALLPGNGGAPHVPPKREPRLWRPLLRYSALCYACGAVITVTLCGYAGSFYPYDLCARFGLGPAALARFPATTPSGS
ncbi:MAG: MFS transporter, partial [Chloroflexia bacterium]